MAKKGTILASFAATLAGMGVSVQSSINGHTSVAVDSPILATFINHTSALVLAMGVAIGIGAFPRALREIRSNQVKLRWWWFLGGSMGAFGVLVIITVIPVVGVVAVGVAVTLGQLAGSVLVDSVGFGVGGRRPMNAFRFAGIAVAILAVFVGAAGRFEGSAMWLLPLAIAAGVMIAIQQATNGWLIVATGEFAVMSVINFALSVVLVASVLLVMVIGQPMELASIPAWAPLGGVLGGVIGVVTALVANKIGVLSLMLCIAAGQAIASVFLDLLMPVDDMGLTIGAVVGMALTVCAVGIAGMGGLRKSSDAPS